MTQEDIDQNLLFGVLALQSDLIDSRQFVDACTLWASRKETPLADILVEQGALDEEDREHVEYLLNRKLKKNNNDAKTSLAGTPDNIRQIMASITSAAVQQSMTGIKDTYSSGSSTTIVGRIEQDHIRRKTLHSTGGIGHIWLAQDNVIEREIALKELRSDRSDAANRERFRREAKLTGQLEHPGIIPVHDYKESEDGTHCYYTMRFVRGHTLSEVIKAYHEARSEADVQTSRLLELLEYFVSACNTIAFAHSKRILHRDLKGENIIVGDFGEVVVLDWGLAKRLGQVESPADALAETIIASDVEQTLFESEEMSPGQTLQGETLGTPAYMAPEQAKGWIDQVDERTDVYGLAAILYEILTGRPPFDSGNVFEVLRQVVEVPPRPPRETNRDVPIELETICLQGLAKSPKDRPQSAKEMAGAIRIWLADRAERKRSERERERFFALSPDLLGIMNEEGVLQQSNPAWTRLLQIEENELYSIPIRDHVDGADWIDMQSALKSVIETGESASIENRLHDSLGRQYWISWSISRIADEVLVYLVGRNVTERKHDEQRFHGLLESAPDATIVIDETSSIVFANSQAEKVFGYTPDELIGKPIETLVPDRFRAAHPAHVRQFFDHPDARPMGAALELFGRRKDGTEFPAEVSLSPVQTEKGLLVSSAIRDVTERRRAQRFCEALLESAPDAMVVTTANRIIKFANTEASNLFGYLHEELIGQTVELLMPERYRQQHPENFARYIADPHVRRMGAGQSLTGLHRDGKEFPIEVSLSPIYTDDGVLISSAIRRR
ncbi:PAS domain S-box protein [Calycomorphotria hydatis]|uniref:Serine/threonine-protein kinase PknD n=1 Tax=Calycomorphotria hydatis TaxID=2528027 RepID=A0A517TA71_9PLAN|nr:PAS domain S-box protein [Calycomorphotria hydatis]QDT65266.1 Serine/threonine-protein kinase PknD [Calycomorphotria hydatis]